MKILYYAVEFLLRAMLMCFHIGTDLLAIFLVMQFTDDMVQAVIFGLCGSYTAKQLLVETVRFYQSYDEQLKHERLIERLKELQRQTQEATDAAKKTD